MMTEFLELLSKVLFGMVIISAVTLIIFAVVVVALFGVALFNPEWFAENIKGMYEDVS